MAEFCNQCEPDYKDFYSPKHRENEEKLGLYRIVICEGCGPIQVDWQGNCVSVDCLEKHNTPKPQRG